MPPPGVVAHSQSDGFVKDLEMHNVSNRRQATVMPSEQSGHLSRAQDANGGTWQAAPAEIAAE